MHKTFIICEFAPDAADVFVTGKIFNKKVITFCKMNFIVKIFKSDFKLF